MKIARSLPIIFALLCPAFFYSCKGKPNISQSSEAVKSGPDYITLPGGFDWKRVNKTRKPEFQAAIALQAGGLETRFEYRKANEDPLTNRDPSNEFFLRVFSFVGAGGLDPTTPFDAQKLAKDFQADWVGLRRIKDIKENSGSGYRNCIAVGIRRPGMGTLYIFHFFDNEDLILSDMAKATYSTKLSS